ncbi:SpoIIE family protein phosphatase, partial [Candidatus Micrarchaeota archaeon]|nr:SpoIIE family protein phosphatase [Candidatus Micrarchaeota archaeon]
GAGEERGRLASRFTSMVVNKTFEPRKRGTLLRAALEAHEKLVNARSRSPFKKGGGQTTLSALHIGKRKAHVVHAGDSSIFLLREGKLQKITKPEHPLIQGIGTQPFMEPLPPSSGSFKVRTGDVFLLCTDGLTGHETTITGKRIGATVLGEEDIEKILGKVAEGEKSPKQAAEKLVLMARAKERRRGHCDNVTTLVLKIK